METVEKPIFEVQKISETHTIINVIKSNGQVIKTIKEKMAKRRPPINREFVKAFAKTGYKIASE